MKKTLSILLSILLLLGTFAFALPAFAADDTPKLSGTCGDNITWTLANGTLTVNGTGELKKQTREFEKTYQTWDSDTQTLISKTETFSEEYYPWQDAIKANAEDYVRDMFGIDISDIGDGAIGSGEIPVDAAAAYLCKHYEQIKRIVIGEGITAVSGYLTGGISDGIGSVLELVDLPSTLERFWDSEELPVNFTKKLIIRNPAFDFNANRTVIQGYSDKTLPYTSLEAVHDAIHSSIKEMVKCQRMSAFEEALNDIYTHTHQVCQSCDPQNFNQATDEAFLNYLNHTYNQNAESISTFTEAVIARLNALLGTAWTSIDDIYEAGPCDCGSYCCRPDCACQKPVLTAQYQAMQKEIESLPFDFVSKTYWSEYELGKEPHFSGKVYDLDNNESTLDVALTPAPWLTVYGHAGSTTETAAATSEVHFVALEDELPPLTASGTCGDNITWTLQDGTLTIHGTGKLEPLIGENDELYYPWAQAISAYATNYACARAGISRDDFKRADALFFDGTITAQALADLNADAFCAAFAQLHTLVVGEGITSVPSDIFCQTCECLQTIDLPSTLTEISDYNHEVELRFVRQLIIRNPAFDFDAIDVMLHGSDANEVQAGTLIPPAAFEDYLNAYTTYWSYAEPLQYASNYALYRLSKVYEFLHADELCAACATYQYNYADLSEGEFLQRLNDFYHANEPTLETFTEKAIARINEARGTSFTSLDDFYVAGPCNCSADCCKNGCNCVGMEEGPAFHTEINDSVIGGTDLLDAGNILLSLERCFALGNQPVEIVQYYGGEEGSFPVIPAPWLTIYGYAGSTAETAAATSEINFIPLCPTDASHTVTETAGIPATCTAAGHTEGLYCRDCSTWLTGETLAPLAHKNAQDVAEAAPTATAHGYTAGVFCPDCNTWLSGHDVIHNQRGDREVVKEATESEEGEVYIVCTVCGESGLYALEKLPHTEPQPEQPSDHDNDSSPNLFERIRRFAKSIVDWFLRLIRWVGKR